MRTFVFALIMVVGMVVNVFAWPWDKNYCDQYRQRIADFSLKKSQLILQQYNQQAAWLMSGGNPYGMVFWNAVLTSDLKIKDVKRIKKENNVQYCQVDVKGSAQNVRLVVAIDGQYMKLVNYNVIPKKQ